MPCEREFVAQLECVTLLEILVVLAALLRPATGLTFQHHRT